MRGFFYRNEVLLGLAVLTVPCLVTPAWTANDGENEIYLDVPDPEPPPTVVQRRKAEDKYTDGTMRIQREVIRLSNDRFVNDGPYREFYPDGQPFSEGSYKRGVLHGQWIYWHANGQICKTTVFKDGLPNGSWEVFRKDGSRLSSKTYEAGLRQGHWTRYFEDGVAVKTEEPYVQGKLQGVRINYYPSGQKRQESHFKDSKLDGLMTEWDEAGNKVVEIQFVKGKINGKMVRWNADGTEIQ